MCGYILMPLPFLSGCLACRWLFSGSGFSCSMSNGIPQLWQYLVSMSVSIAVSIIESKVTQSVTKSVTLNSHF